MNNTDKPKNMRDVEDVKLEGARGFKETKLEGARGFNKEVKLEGARGFNKEVKLEGAKPEESEIRGARLGSGNLLEKYDDQEATERNLTGSNARPSEGVAEAFSPSIQTLSVCINGQLSSMDFYVV